jgi:hypothetical protein
MTAKMFGFKEYPSSRRRPKRRQFRRSASESRRCRDSRPGISTAASRRGGDVLLPWERLLWSARPWQPRPLLRGERYLLTDFRLLCITRRTIAELALDDIGEIHRTESSATAFSEYRLSPFIRSPVPRR